MIAGTYLTSAALAVVLGVLLLGGTLDRWSFIAMVGVIFFFASAGASSAYLTVSEIFPMETRALAIAFFYAVGTGIGGITGPLLFGNLIASGKISEVALGFFIGAAVMAVGGAAEILFGVRSEQRSLEAIAEPLTAEDAEEAGDGEGRERPTTSVTASRRERLRPGPGSQLGWPGMPLPARRTVASNSREVDQIVRTLRERGATSRHELGRALGARQWGPGRLSESLRAAQRAGQARRVARSRYDAPLREPQHTASDGAPRESPQTRPSGGPSTAPRAR
jgi:hypothetical protein